MTHPLEVQAASLLICGFPGPTSDDQILSAIGRGIAGVVLFSRNIQDPRQVATLINSLQEARLGKAPLLISVDQEGGKVARLKPPITRFPEQSYLGRIGDLALARRFGEVLGLELRALGFNLNYSPVMDVHSNPLNPIIGGRAFSSQPQQVADLGVHVIRGMQSEGVLACAKHFPGHGDTSTDSHLELPELSHDLDRLWRVELLPFRAAAQADVATMMTAHIRFKAVDPEVPATLSKAVLQGLLREKIGYRGVIVSDDLEMKAIVDHYGVGEAVTRGLMAGVDAFLICHEAPRQEEALRALVSHAESSAEARARLSEASSRMAALRDRIGPYVPVNPDQLEEWLGRPAHQSLAHEIFERGAPVAASS